MSEGKIYLVGFGPGAEDQMTLRAKEAIIEADVVIGYSTYIKLVEDLLDGKEVIRKGMTEEIDRCVLAYDKAQAGHKVALISSGDIGVYGMAGPTFEVLFEQGWTPSTGIKVEVVPGTTALCASASLVGAPLTHDFCSISLSDLLTPWPVIAARLEAAAKADFVVALYNPKSGRRVGQIVEAQEILLQHRAATTPVAIVKSAYRKRQHINLVQLSELKDQDIGMLTTVLIGNSKSFIKEGLLITPRGYSNKYQGLLGQAKEGEQAGRSLSLGLDGFLENALEALAKGVDLSLWAATQAVSLGYLLNFLERHAPGQVLRLDLQGAEAFLGTCGPKMELRFPGGMQCSGTMDLKNLLGTSESPEHDGLKFGPGSVKEKIFYQVTTRNNIKELFVIDTQFNTNFSILSST